MGCSDGVKEKPVDTGENVTKDSVVVSTNTNTDTLPSNTVVTNDSTQTVESVTPDQNNETTSPGSIANTNNNLAANGACLPPGEFSLKLTLMAEQMEKDSLMYDNKNPSRFQDCSGIFHQIAKKVSGWCPSYRYPDPKIARDSRSLAGWYHQNNNLVIVEDPMESRKLIRPGSVMFFGGSGKKFQNMTIEQLSAPAPKGIVEHIGVVTEVSKDDNGEVIGYVMMHGRRPGVTAQRSHYHKVQPPRFGYPILGNWEQQWIGISNVMTPL